MLKNLSFILLLSSCNFVKADLKYDPIINAFVSTNNSSNINIFEYNYLLRDSLIIAERLIQANYNTTREIKLKHIKHYLKEIVKTPTAAQLYLDLEKFSKDLGKGSYDWNKLLN